MTVEVEVGGDGGEREMELEVGEQNGEKGLKCSVVKKNNRGRRKTSLPDASDLSEKSIEARRKEERNQIQTRYNYVKEQKKIKEAKRESGKRGKRKSPDNDKEMCEGEEKDKLEKSPESKKNKVKTRIAKEDKNLSKKRKGQRNNCWSEKSGRRGL